MNDCIFCKIVKKEVPSFTVWENDQYQAFLTIFPNTEGFTVVIPKEHYRSYIFEAPEEIMNGLMSAAKKVSKKIKNAYKNVGHVGVMFEGYGVNHLHVKLMPLHETKSDEWKQHASHVKTFFKTYEGYMSSHDGERADDTWLKEVAEKIKNA
jgi:histidine triad (HIT) family protein